MELELSLKIFMFVVIALLIGIGNYLKDLVNIGQRDFRVYDEHFQQIDNQLDLIYLELKTMQDQIDAVKRED
jgi:hypothetical protein